MRYSLYRYPDWYTGMVKLEFVLVSTCWHEGHFLRDRAVGSPFLKGVRKLMLSFNGIHPFVLWHVSTGMDINVKNNKLLIISSIKAARFGPQVLTSGTKIHDSEQKVNMHVDWYVPCFVRKLNAENVLKINKWTLILLIYFCCIMVTNVFRPFMWPSLGWFIWE